jgi:hypothetical protein
MTNTSGGGGGGEGGGYVQCSRENCLALIRNLQGCPDQWLTVLGFPTTDKLSLLTFYNTMVIQQI